MKAVINSINGSVQSQGIRVDVDAWLLIGSKEWEATPDEVKAYAYQAALATGWTDEALINAVVTNYSHLDRAMMEFVIEELHALKQAYPLETKTSS